MTWTLTNKEPEVKKISKATTKQWAAIEQLRIRWLTEEQTAQYDVAAIRAAVWKRLDAINHPRVPVWVVDSPVIARVIDAVTANLYAKLRANLNGNLYANLYANTLTYYCGLWWNVDAAWFEAGEILGVPKHKFHDEFLEWNRLCPVWMWSKHQIFVLRRPQKIHWQSTDGTLHNDAGPSVYYSPLFSLWHIDGIAVDEQIVMRPETQTIEQINSEANEEVRRIRIERFGVMRYLEESNAKVLDSRRNEIENTYEILVETPQGQRLVTHCPSGSVTSRTLSESGLSTEFQMNTFRSRQDWRGK